MQNRFDDESLILDENRINYALTSEQRLLMEKCLMIVQDLIDGNEVDGDLIAKVGDEDQVGDLIDNLS